MCYFIDEMHFFRTFLTYKRDLLTVQLVLSALNIKRNSQLFIRKCNLLPPFKYTIKSPYKIEI